MTPTTKKLAGNCLYP